MGMMAQAGSQVPAFMKLANKAKSSTITPATLAAASPLPAASPNKTNTLLNVSNNRLAKPTLLGQ